MSGTILICKKSLYKSTYNGNAFTVGKPYRVAEADSDYIWVVDDEGKKFSFSREEVVGYYYFNSYFI
jgi:hypothetical protein